MLPEVGEIKQGTVARVYRNYAIMIFTEGYSGLLHISEASNKYIRNFPRYIKIGSIYSVKIIEVDQEKKTVKVSLKQVDSSSKAKLNKGNLIPEEEIDFSALKEKLPGWIKQKEGQK